VVIIFVKLKRESILLKLIKASKYDYKIGIYQISMGSLFFSIAFIFGIRWKIIAGQLHW